VVVGVGVGGLANLPLEHLERSFGGKASRALLKLVSNVSMYNSTGNHPWRSIKGGGEPLSTHNTFEEEEKK